MHHQDTSFLLVFLRARLSLWDVVEARRKVRKERERRDGFFFLFFVSVFAFGGGRRW